MLVEMDGFESNEGVILMAATNRPDVLDPALLRPGRFDRRVVVGNPDVKGRMGILNVHTRRTPLDSNVELEIIAKGTPGFSGADLENLVNEAALIAARTDKMRFKWRVSSLPRTRWQWRPSAAAWWYRNTNENAPLSMGGHAIVARMLPEADRVHKVTIVPRGRALGVTMMLPDEDRLGATVNQLKTKMAIFMGGRAAEELVLDDYSTGAANDLMQATRIARAMVTQYGMSDVLGPTTLNESAEVFLGRDFGRKQDYSESTAMKVDGKSNASVTMPMPTRNILTANMHILHRLVKF